jgi:hypothetical protein
LRQIFGVFAVTGKVKCDVVGLSLVAFHELLKGAPFAPAGGCD